ARASVRPVEQGADILRRALEDRFDPAVGQVAHPAGHAVLLGEPPAAIAEEDALHPAGDQHPIAHHKQTVPLQVGEHAAPPGRDRYRPAIRSAARSAMASTVAAGWALGMAGITDASATRSPVIPRTRSSRSTTAPASGPIRQVPTGW